MLSDMDHPLRRLRALADWLLRWEPLPGELGRVDWAHRTHVESRRQLPHGQTIGVTGDSFGSI